MVIEKDVEEMYMAMPKAMRLLESQLAERNDDPGFNLLAHLSTLINENGLTLSQSAATLAVPRETLSNWLYQCGYEYAVTRRLAPISPVVMET